MQQKEGGSILTEIYIRDTMSLLIKVEKMYENNYK